MISISEIERVIAELEKHKDMANNQKKIKRLTSERLYHSALESAYTHTIKALKELLPK